MTAAADTLERIAAENYSDPATDDLTVPLAIKLAETETENAKLRAALKPFAGAVFNDNGDMTISPVSDREAYIKAYFALKRVNT